MIPPDATVDPGAHVGNSLIIDPAHLTPHASLQDAVISGLEPVGTGVSGINVPLTTLTDSVTDETLQAIHWPRKGSRVQEIQRKGSGRRFLRISRGRKSAVGDSLLQGTRG